MKMSPVAATLAVVLLAGLVRAQIPKDGRCIWYDVGPQNPDKDPGMYLNLAYSGAGKVLDDFLALARMDEHCDVLMKELRKEFGERVPLCCSAGNIADMTMQFSILDPFLDNCLACKTNIKMNLCYSTCHPRHSNFLIPTKIYHYKDDEGRDKEAVWEVDFHVTDYYTNTTYDSCKNVYMSELNRPAMTILCGNEGYNCDPYKLFTYFGNNSLAPFTITYKWGNTTTKAHDEYTGEMRTMTPFLKNTTPCNTTDKSMHCLCQHCYDSCSAFPDIPTHPDLPMVGGVDIITFTLIIVYCILAIAIIVAACFCWSDTDEGCCCCCTCPCSQVISAGIEKGVRKVFTCLGTGVAKHPLIFLAMGACLVVGLTIGVAFLEVTTDPIELWTSSASKTRQQKEYFDSHFSPFYRSTQVIITPKGYEWANVTLDSGRQYLFGPALNSTFVQRVMKLQTEIMGLKGEVDGRQVSLKEVCDKPMAPKSEECRIESVMNYWQNDPLELNKSIEEGDYSNKIVQCISIPTSIEPKCLGSYGGPVQPYTALGGFLKEGENLSLEPRYTESTALLINIHISNHLEKNLLVPAMAWEKRFIEFMKEVTTNEEWTVDMDIAFTTERGVEDELRQESQVDALPFAAACLIMLAYLTFSLGKLCVECNRLMIESKILLSLGGVILVLLSTGASCGFYGYVGVPATLLITEVMPFLVLAVGMDNIFILVQTWQQEPRKEGESVEEHVGRVVGKVAPSMLLSTTAEALCFFLGALSDIPAVYSFALYAGFALVIIFFLQMTCFVAFMSLDARRVEDNRWDVLCCIKSSRSSNSAQRQCTVCHDIFDQFYAPFILSDIMRVLICLVFTGVACAALASAPHIEIGLDQSLSMPEDSFVFKYFKYTNDYLSVGPPVYFVIKEGYNFTDWDEQSLVCEVDGCDDDSLLQQVFVSSHMPDDTYLALPAKSWLGSYFVWLMDNVESNGYMFACCRLDAEGNFINSSNAFDFNSVETCRKVDDFVNGRPKPQYFMEHVQDFLSDYPHGSVCSSAGHLAFGQAVELVTDVLTGEQKVGATYYKTRHTNLKTSGDFIRALEVARYLTDDMTDHLRVHSKYSPDIEVFPYSIFYVYYEQYLTMWQDTGISLGISIGSVFAVTLLLTFDLTSSLVILATISMITADMMGFMYWWNISLNAVSLVNLVMAIGISMEFCSHITHAFATSVKPTRLERAHEALATMGSSVLSGITLTKIGGIFVLGFAQSQIFRVFYFRMYLGMVLFGASHGLMFLPVLLSLCGPPVNQVLLKQKREKDEVAALENKLKEAQKQNAMLKRQLDAEVAVSGSQQQEVVVSSVTVQHIHHHQPHPSLYPSLSPAIDTINQQLQRGKGAASPPTTSGPSAPGLQDLLSPLGGVTNKG